MPMAHHTVGIRSPDNGSLVLRGNIPPRGYIRSPDNGSLVLRGNIPVGHIRQDTVSTDIPPRGYTPVKYIGAYPGRGYWGLQVSINPPTGNTSGRVPPVPIVWYGVVWPSG